MKVKDLINMLSTFDPEKEVYIKKDAIQGYAPVYGVFSIWDINQIECVALAGNKAAK